MLAHGRVWFLDSGDTQAVIGSDVTGSTCVSTANCQPGQFRIVALGLDVDPASVSATTDRQTGMPVVTFAFKDAARLQFAAYTRQNIGLNLTITLDEKVIESATIQSEIDGQGQITGLASEWDAQRLAIFLKDGTLPLDLTVRTELVEQPIAYSGDTSPSSQTLGTHSITPHIAHPAAVQPAYTAADVRAYV
ncbi:MAG: SecDF P1 head subdomain-containing protein [Ktedonobacterales bacterium]